MRLILSAALAAISLSAAADAAVPFGDRVAALRAAGAAAVDRGDYETAIREFEADLALQPGHRGLLAHLALLEFERGDHAAAAARLRRVADVGAAVNVERLSEQLGESAGADPFVAILERLAANAATVGGGKIVAEIADTDLLVEGVAAAADGRMFASTVVGRRILARAEDGTWTTFADADDGLFSVFGLGVDDANGVLWAASGVLDQTPLAEAEEAGTALLAFDLATGAVRARFTLDGDGANLSDMTVAADGTAYVSDTGRGRVYKATRDGESLDEVVASPEFMSLQGLAVVGETLYAADYGRGLWRVNLADGAMAAVAAPDDVSLIGLDGLAAAPDGSLIGIQNGFNPQRVVRLTLSDDGARVTRLEVLAAALPEFEEPTLGVVHDGRFVFVANSQWEKFPAEGDAPEREPTRIMAIDAH